MPANTSAEAVDRFKANRAERRVWNAQDHLLQTECAVQDGRDHLQEAQQLLERRINEKEQAQRDFNTKQCELVEANEKVSCPRDETIDPETGLPIEETVEVHEEAAQVLEKMKELRFHMDAGDVERALVLDRELCELCGKLEYHVDPRALGASDAVYISHADFCWPKSLVTDDEVVKATLQYAQENPEETDPEQCSMERIIRDGLSVSLGIPSDHYPKDVNVGLMVEIRKIRSAIHSALRREGNADEGYENDEHSDDENHVNQEMNGRAAGEQNDDEILVDEDSNNESDDDRAFEMREQDDADGDNEDDAWTAVKDTIRGYVTKVRSKSKQELKLPRETSAAIARYNHDAHFLFHSEQAQVSCDKLTDALVTCRLRNRPTCFSQEERARTPFEYRTPGGVCGFDVEGDMIAMCGDLSDSDIFSHLPYVAFQTVPCATNLDSAQTLGHMKDAKTGNSAPWDTEVWSYAYKDRRGKECYNQCVADPENERVWCSSTRSGQVHAFSTTQGVARRRQRQIGVLSFDEEEKKKQHWRGCYELARCGTCLVGSAGTARLSVWPMNAAVSEYGLFKGSFIHQDNSSDDEDESGDGGQNDCEDEGDSSTSSQHKSPSKRLKATVYEGTKPCLLALGTEGSFRSGDVEYLDSSEVLVAPASAGHSLRIFDITAGAVSGVVVGFKNSTIRLNKQYCAASSNIGFAMGSTCGVVFDLRTCQPSIMLMAERDSNILGVPGGSNIPVAFTFSDEPSLSESISCWDLRMPGSHVYTMATGNTYIQNLFWHEHTASLIASTNTQHKISHGRASGYMYGERLSDEEEDAVYTCNWWPPRSQHERTYFGEPWHCDFSSPILQYPFESGVPMGVSLQRAT